MTPLDCFWEGSLLHNPLKSVENLPKSVAAPEYCPNIPNITWSNLNVTELQTCMRNNDFQFNSLVEEVTNYSTIVGIAKCLAFLFQGLVKAGVNGYINKPCITNRSDCPSQVCIVTTIYLSSLHYICIGKTTTT